jgi:hypothetical protein
VYSVLTIVPHLKARLPAALAIESIEAGSIDNIRLGRRTTWITGENSKLS